MSEKTRQEEGYEYVSSTFIRLLQDDPRISTEHKRTVLAWWEDLFAHDGVKNNMLQAFSNFFDEVDQRVDATRKAGIAQVDEAISLYAGGVDKVPDGYIKLDQVHAIIKQLLDAENSPEETVDAASMDLTELGEEDEDDTPLV